VAVNKELDMKRQMCYCVLIAFVALSFESCQQSGIDKALNKVIYQKLDTLSREHHKLLRVSDSYADYKGSVKVDLIEEFGPFHPGIECCVLTPDEFILNYQRLNTEQVFQNLEQRRDQFVSDNDSYRLSYFMMRIICT